MKGIQSDPEPVSYQDKWHSLRPSAWITLLLSGGGLSEGPSLGVSALLYLAVTKDLAYSRVLFQEMIVLSALGSTF